MEKQAVLLIHGIGEQRPMDTLRSFVRAVWSSDTTLHKNHPNSDAVWSKPYQLSENFELRRLTTPENRAGIRTDFFELYWAHLMSGNKFAHVMAWIKTLLWRSPSTVPKHLRLAYVALMALVLVGLVLAYQLALTRSKDGPDIPFWASVLVSIVVVPSVYWVMENIVGDAARYLDAAPSNIQRRHEIRSAGLSVLKALHDKDYERIVVVGHSLGTVIGYDMLSYAWSTFNTDAITAATPSFVALRELERLAEASHDATKSVTAAEFHFAQRKYLNELTANGNRWRVTDFITLGSPLAHAEVLLAKNAKDLAPKFEARELPKSPPVLEATQRNKSMVRRFSYPVDSATPVPHHAAVFGPTRWTNLYFPNRMLLWGDLVGGKLQRIFGGGVDDIAVTTRHWGGLLSHTFYWTPDDRDNGHLNALRKVLDLLDGNNGVAPPSAAD